MKNFMLDFLKDKSFNLFLFVLTFGLNELNAVNVTCGAFLGYFSLVLLLPIFDYGIDKMLFRIFFFCEVKCWMILIDDNLVIFKFFVLVEQYLIKDTDSW